MLHVARSPPVKPSRAFRAPSLERNQSGKDVRSLTAQLKNGSSDGPNLEKLQQLCLNSSLVIDPTQLTVVSVIGEGAFGVVWKCQYTALEGTLGAEYVRSGKGFVALKKVRRCLPCALRFLFDSVSIRLGAPSYAVTLR